MSDTLCTKAGTLGIQGVDTEIVPDMYPARAMSGLKSAGRGLQMNICNHLKPGFSIRVG
jgi:hypothetical protein